jgi:hypothetical protein
MLAAAPFESRGQLLRASGFRFQSQTGVVIELRLVPQWTQELTPVPGSELDTGLSYSQLALAHTAVEVMPVLSSGRPPRRLCSTSGASGRTPNGVSPLVQVT